MHPSRPLSPSLDPSAAPAEDGGPPLSIGLYCPGWPPEGFANGIITYVEAIAEGMTRLGHRPYILAGSVAEPISEAPPAPVLDLRPLYAPGLPGKVAEALAYRLDPKAPATRIMRIARGLRRVIQGAEGYPRLDILEVEETLGLPGTLGRRRRVPVVARLHGPWFLNGPNQGGDPSSREFARRVWIEGKVLRVVEGITGPSQDVIDRTRAYYNHPLPEAEAIPNPVRLVPADRQWRVETSEPDHIVFIGRFDRHKGGDTILDAFAVLLRDRPSARLTFVGPDRGLDRDGRRWTLPEYLEHRLPGALAEGRVQWLGRRPPSDVAELRRRAAVTVVASRYETFAITITEAMAAGCPLVATRAGGASELFEDGLHGRYVDPEDPEGMASALAWMLADPARSAKLGAAAAEYCRRNYTPEIVAEQTIRFYRRVLAKRATPGILESKESRP